MKLCKGCNATKPLRDFSYKDGEHKMRKSKCKGCIAEEHRLRRAPSAKLKLGYTFPSELTAFMDKHARLPQRSASRPIIGYAVTHHNGDDASLTRLRKVIVTVAPRYGHPTGVRYACA